MYYKNEFNEIMENLTNKSFIKYIMSIQSLIARLEEKGIEDDELNSKFGQLQEVLKEYLSGEDIKRRKTARAFNEIVQHVAKKYNLQQKGSLQGAYLAIFMGVGIAMGSTLSTTLGTAFMGAGIAIGAGLGVAIGASLEKKAEEEGRLY